MTIRKTKYDDLASVMEIYQAARTFMKQAGNPTQWKTNHPPKAQIEKDISMGKSYVCENNDGILAVFFFDTNPDSTYAKIDGAWLNDSPYGVVHRIARNYNLTSAKGVGAFCINQCFKEVGNIRIDTHENNAPMIKMLETLGFVRCGIIWLENGEERIAFQKC